MSRIVKLEGIALVLLVSSTSQAGLPAHLTGGSGSLEQRLAPRARNVPRIRVEPATPAAVDLALFELIERFEDRIAAVTVCDLPSVLVAIVAPVANDNVVRPVQTIGTLQTTDDAQAAPVALATATEPGAHTPDVAERAIFAATQHGPFDDQVLAAGSRWRIDPFLLKGLLANESNLEPVRSGKRRYARHNGSRVVISGGAIGIAQFSGGGIRAVQALRNRRQRQGERVLGFDLDRALVPHEAIHAAAELLAHLLSRFGRDGGITAYNSGTVGGLAVSRLGFWRARHAGKLRRTGIYLIQGERFLLNVLRRTNRYRRAAGLAPLHQPARPRPGRRVTRVAVL